MTNERNRMRTQDEIIKRFKEVEKEDFLGFRREILCEEMTVESARKVLGKQIDDGDLFSPSKNDEEIISRMKEYMEFAIEKAEDHRGLSASRSIMKMTEYLWLLKDDENLTEVMQYKNYGAPILRRICDKYNLMDEEFSREFLAMSAGNKCYPECKMGCV
jgi:hypothetical protein